MKKLRIEKGFTLAETLITLTILGVVAAITVPSLINKQIESANRTKVKKAMAVYEKALNQMIIDNDIKGDVSVLNGSTCATTRPYFKTVENGTDNCKFKTSDRVWWDITDIEKPIIAFKDTDLTAENAADSTTNKAFYLIGRRADGILRINDKGYEDSITSGNDTNIAAMLKLYNFINNTMTEGEGTIIVSQEEINPMSRICSNDTKNNDGKYTLCVERIWSGSSSDDSEFSTSEEFLNYCMQGETEDFCKNLQEANMNKFKSYDENGDTLKVGDECNYDYTACAFLVVRKTKDDGTMYTWEASCNNGLINVETEICNGDIAVSCYLGNEEIDCPQ